MYDSRIRWRIVVTGLVMLTLGVASVGSASGTRDGDRPAPAGMACVINLTARNEGSSDIWIMLYESQMRRSLGNTSIYGPWQKLKIQNHRVAPGVTIKRSWTDPTGSCAITRQWRWKLKNGTNFYTATGSKFGSSPVDLGDLSKHFR